MLSTTKICIWFVVIFKRAPSAHFQGLTLISSLRAKRRTVMDIKAKIRDAQKRIIDNLAQGEESIAELYAAYSHNLPEMASFW